MWAVLMQANEGLLKINYRCFVFSPARFLKERRLNSEIRLGSVHFSPTVLTNGFGL